MRRILIVLFILLLSGCQTKEVVDDNLLRYQAIENSIIEKSEFKCTSQYYDMELEMSKIDENNYRYYLTLLNPKVAMYDLIVAAKDVDEFNNDELMMPSKGIFDDIKYKLIPNQYNPEKGFVKGIILSGIKTIEDNQDPYIDLRLYVQWKNQDYSIDTVEYLQIKHHLRDVTHHEVSDEEGNENADYQDNGVE